MKDTKKEFKFFTVPEWEKEQEYLRQQHQAGWKFVKVSGLCMYHFVKCEPEDVVYQLDYNQEGVAHKEEYVQMFRDCGWEYLQDYVGYSYFRKPAAEMNGDEQIFCDDVSRLDMMKRVLVGRMLPLLCIFLCIILPNLVSMICIENHLLISVFGVLLGVYLVIFAKFGIQYWKYWKSLNG